MTAPSDWTPPVDPDPRAILREAKQDAAEGRCADALAKHLWFHKNALAVDEAFRGVRLSFALLDWLWLADQYAPALDAFLRTREQAEGTVRSGREQQLSEDERYQAFNDFVSMNEYLHEPERTVALYRWLDVQEPGLARLTLHLAKRALIPAGELALCGKYLRPEEDLKRAVTIFRRHLKIARERTLEISKKGFAEIQEFGEQRFSSEVGVLVALLVINERSGEAQVIRDRAIQEWDNAEFQDRLGRALQGEMPRCYPHGDGR